MAVFEATRRVPREEVTRRDLPFVLWAEGAFNLRTAEYPVVSLHPELDIFSFIPLSFPTSPLSVAFHFDIVQSEFFISITIVSGA